MKYDFTTLQKRIGIGSHKWDAMKRLNPNVSDDAVPFTTADMEFVNAPEIRKAVADYAMNNILGYTAATDAYYDSLKKWMKKHHDLEFEKENVIIYPGVVPALYKIVETFTNDGDGVIIMPPVYGPFFGAIRANGRNLAKCPLINTDEYYTVDFELFEKLCKDEKNKVFILCNPHNPVGRVWHKDELEKMAKICMENNVLIVSDEIHFDIIMPGYTLTSMGTFDFCRDNLIVCTAPSKTFNLASMQTSNIIVWNKDICAALNKNKSLNCIESMNVLGFISCQAAYDYCEDWMYEMIETVDGNIKYFRNFIKENLPMLSMPVTEGTYLGWVNFNKLGMTKNDLQQFLVNHEIFFVSGKDFGEESEGYMRVNFACPHKCVVDLCDKLLSAIKELN